MENRLLGPLLYPDETFRVKVSHVDSPQRFFVTKLDDYEQIEELHAEMCSEYSSSGKETQRIYYPQIKMCCALRVSGRWHRGCVEDITSPNHIRVRLVDDGRSVTVDWRQLHTLKDRFLASREFSIECSLADVEPLPENNYEWTDIAIAEFVRLTSNPDIQMTVSSCNQFRYQVILNVMEENIGATMIQLKHALSTGNGSPIDDNVRESPTPPTTRIQVVHINDPGEFYIHLVEHIPAILKFQERIQIAQENRLAEMKETVSADSWKENDHCLILTSANESASEQWHRGIIREIDENDPETPYTVFLRDHGVEVRYVHSGQLSAIEQNYDRVTDAAILCHLACVQPTGGMENWSDFASDEFNHNIGQFESIGVTIQGEITNGSIPVVLWGMLTETNDAPKYTNINEMLVNAGLAHLVEEIDIARQMDPFVQEDIQQGQQTLQEWYENFKNSLDSLSMNKVDDPKLENSNENCDLLENCESGIVTEWLPAEPIDKTVFTAYPTYVDYDGIVYLHDAEKHNLLNRMRKKINEEVNLEIAKTTDENWTPGQPCLARYHLDSHLYRAVIECCLPNKRIVVKFVDYGNIETCKLEDLYRITPFANVPIQAVPFSIDGICPKDGKDTFSIRVLDLMHGMIVNNLCSIQVSYGEENKAIKKCKIRIDGSDLANYLIKNEFVSHCDDEENS